MAKYTIELQDVVKNHNIFDFPYPFYDERKRPEFEEKFIRHFYFREIGCPTVDRFMVYLRDKMETVFPYYNELFKTAEIEYSILNNYNLTEEFTTTRESESKHHGYASAVGQLFGTQQTDSETNRENATTGKLDSTGTDTDTEKTVTTTETNGKTLTEATGKNTTTKTENVTTETNNSETAETDNSETANGSKSNVRKFIDTPQGLADLTDTKFMTDLTDTRETDSRTAKTDSKTTTDTTGNTVTDTTGNTVTDTTDNSESNTESTGTTTTQRDGEKNTTLAQNTTGSETGKDTTTATATDEQKTTSDSNTRTYADGRQTEKHTLTRIGNIGVDTDSDMIEKHNRLQKTLRQIEKLFFDECEDLFMLVY